MTNSWDQLLGVKRRDANAVCCLQVLCNLTIVHAFIGFYSHGDAFVSDPVQHVKMTGILLGSFEGGIDMFPRGAATPAYRGICTVTPSFVPNRGGGHFYIPTHLPESHKESQTS